MVVMEARDTAKSKKERSQRASGEWRGARRHAVQRMGVDGGGGRRAGKLTSEVRKIVGRRQGGGARPYWDRTPDGGSSAAVRRR